MNLVYKSHVIHDRRIPKKYKFGFNFFWYYMDLDRLDELDSSSKLISYNRFNLFSLYDKDHFQKNGKTIKEKLIDYLRSNGVTKKVKSTYILTNLRFLGYVFNPVCYYYITTEDEQKYCVIEICNTYLERKAYFIDSKFFDGEKFSIEVAKEFYISPFSPLDNTMKFVVTWPSENVKIDILDYQKDRKLEISTHLKAKSLVFSDLNLLKAAFLKPFATFQVIWAIHWHALILFLKKVPYFKKDDNKHLQRGYY